MLTKQEIIEIKKNSRTSSMEPWSDSVAFAEKIQEAVLKKLAPELEQAMLYRWLRDFPKKSYHTFGHERKVVAISYQYAPKRVDGDELDSGIKREIFNDCVNYLSEEQGANGDARFADPDWRFSDERTNELADLALVKFGSSFEEVRKEYR